MAYAGFDTDIFPGMDTMSALKAQTNLVWCVAYLVAPSHANSSWNGQHLALKMAGWGILPVYVGQQINGPGSHSMTYGRGFIDGADAASKMQDEGYAAGSMVALDLEDGAPFVDPRASYVSSWCRTVTKNGFAPAVYCSHAIAQAVADANPGVRIYAFKVPTVEITSETAPFPTPDPAGCGFDAALAWQYRQNVNIQAGGSTLLVDLDSSTMPDPSVPDLGDLKFDTGPAPIVLAVDPAPVAATPPPLSLNPQSNAYQASSPAMSEQARVYAQQSAYDQYRAAQFIQAISEHPAIPAPTVVRQAPPLAAGAVAAGTAVVGAAHASTSVDFSGFINLMAPYLLVGVIIPALVWLTGRLLQRLHISTQSALGADIVQAVENGARAVVAQGVTTLDAHATVNIGSASVAEVVRYVQTVVPQKVAASGMTSLQLSTLVTNRLNQLAPGAA
jgi:hypothetical protein